MNCWAFPIFFLQLLRIVSIYEYFHLWMPNSKSDYSILTHRYLLPMNFRCFLFILLRLNRIHFLFLFLNVLLSIYLSRLKFILLLIIQLWFDSFSESFKFYSFKYRQNLYFLWKPRFSHEKSCFKIQSRFILLFYNY